MTYSQWIKQKTKLDTDDIPIDDRLKREAQGSRFRYPIGRTYYECSDVVVDNREMFDNFSSVRA